MRYIIIIIFITTFNHGLQAQDVNCSDTTDRYRITPFLSFETLDFNQHTLSVGAADDFRSSYYVLEYSAPITILSRDPYNGNKVNFAVPFIPLYVFTNMDAIREIREFSFQNLLLALLNSQQHIYLWDETRAEHKQRPQWVSLFFRQNIEWFAFRTHQWINYSPSIGFCFHYIDKNKILFDNRARISAEIGYSKEIATNFRLPRYSNSIYISLKIYGSPDH